MMASTSLWMKLDPSNCLNQAPPQLSPEIRLLFSKAWTSQRKSHPDSLPSVIHEFAEHLRSTPQRLYGLNPLIAPQFRLECLTKIPKVNHYVLIEGNKASIYSFSKVNRRSPSSDTDVKNLLSQPKEEWKQMLEENPDREWLACLAQILQEILDDPTTDTSLLSLARKHFIRLGESGILPPSIFVHLEAGDEEGNQAQPSSEYIASGGNCDVYHVVNKGISMCVRFLRQTQTTDVQQLHKQFCKEVMVWRQLKHPNILEFIGVLLEIFPQRFCFVLPWLHHGSIMSYLKLHPDHDKFTSICQIVDGIEYLHSLDPPVVHKDIKGANVLVRDDGVCVLTDFGLAGVLDSQPMMSGDGKGTMLWMAPELFSDRAHPPDKEARPQDIYSLGVTIYEIYTGEIPYAIMTPILRGVQPVLPPDGNPWTEEEVELWGYVKSCLEIKPEDRPPIELVKDALQTIRRWQPCQWQRSKTPNADPSTANSVDSPQPRSHDWQDSQLTQQTPTMNTSIPVHLNRRKSATYKAKGLHTPTTPSHSSLPDLESPQAGPSSPLTTLTPKLLPSTSFRFHTPPMTPRMPAANSLLPSSPLARRLDRRMPRLIQRDTSPSGEVAGVDPRS